jgi:hypothetical protein
VNAQETVEAAITLAKARYAEVPSFGIYASIVLQLEYLSSALSGDIPIDRTKLGTIIIGHYGVREFKETDPEFATALIEAQLIASKMARGLKV